MKCNGKCVCGKFCSVDHEIVTKRCACDGQHHRPHVGERWKFDNGELSYVAEVTSIQPKLKCKIVDIKKKTVTEKVGKVFIPITLTKNGPIPEPTNPRARKLLWSYLPGQETPEA